MTQDEIIRMAQDAGIVRFEGGEMEVYGIGNPSFNDHSKAFWSFASPENLGRFAAIVAAHAKSEQIQNAYQQGCEDMRKRMEKRMYSLESQLQLCQTAVADEREACAKVCEDIDTESMIQNWKSVDECAKYCAAAIRARGEK